MRAPPLASRSLIAVLGLSLALYAWGLRYGLPNVYSWAQDEIIPAEVLEGAQQRFSGGWHSRYPPLHYGLLALAYAPVRWLSPPVLVAYDSITYERLFVTGRLLSLAMAAGTLLLLFGIGVELIGRRAAAFAALSLATSPSFAYYARFANLDVPYLFWFAASLLMLLRVLRTRALGDALASAVAAALAVATKDQAYALYVLTAPALLAAVASARRDEGRAVALRAVLGDERIRLPLAAAALAFVAAHNLLFNPDGFAAHVRLITGDASRDYRMFAADLAGQWSLLKLCARLLVFVLGEPAAALALLGLWLAWRGNERRLLFTLVPILSSQLFFLGLVGYAYDRFLLPHALVLSLFAARSLAAAEGWGAPGRWLRRLAVAALLGVGLLRCVSLDLLLTHDSRYAAEAWLARNVPRSARVAVLGPLEYLPRPDGLQWKQRTELLRAVLGMDPDYVVINADYAARAEDPRAQALYAALASGEAGYRPALAIRTRIDWPLRLDEQLRRRGARLPTNLDKINPEIVVYERAP